MSNTKLLKPSDDIVFKRLFGKVGNERFIKDLLEAILEIKIESVELGKEVEILPDRIQEKTGILDVRVNLPDGTMVDVEMQNVNQKNIPKRMTYYLSRLYASGIERGKDYTNLKKTIGIGILNFNYFNEIEGYHTKWKMTEQNYKENTLEEQEMHFIELPKFSEGTKNMENKLDQWLAFIEYSDKELIEMAKKKNDMVKEATREYQYLTGDEALQRIAFLEEKFEHDYVSAMGAARREGLAQGRKEGLELGKAEGKAEGKLEGKLEGELKAKLETAKRMLELGAEIEFIAKATGLTKEEIEKLK